MKILKKLNQIDKPYIVIFVSILFILFSFYLPGDFSKFFLVLGSAAFGAGLTEITLEKHYDKLRKYKILQSL
jgi:hypothetical protein